MRSSELKQRATFKRIATYNQDLPQASDFELVNGEYPVICSAYNHPETGKQFVFSTRSGDDVNHWVALGVNINGGSLGVWQPDGYLSAATTNNLGGDLITRYYSANALNGNIQIDVSNDTQPTFNTLTHVDITVHDENKIYSTGVPLLTQDRLTLNIPIKNQGENLNTMVDSSNVQVTVRVTGIE